MGERPVRIIVDDPKSISGHVSDRRKDATMDTDVSTVPISKSGHLMPLAGTGPGVLSARDPLVDRPLEIEAARAMERRRLGQELHDDLGQRLAGLAMLAATLRDRLDGRDGDLKILADELADGLHDAGGTVRGIARGLNRPDPSGSSTVEGLRLVAAESRRRCGIACRVEGDPGLELDDPRTCHELTRIAREAISNAVRHGAAETVTLKLRRQPDGVELEVRDDGCGFAPDAVPRGVGLDSMSQRAARLGGVLTIDSRHGDGTVIRCRLDGGRS
jgi:two-component system CheB/CheR fusion protein